VTASAQYVKATIGGHPIHAMIVALPIAFYTAGLVSLIVHAANREPFWFRASMILWFAGVATAAIAAVFGLIDLFAGIPRAADARKTGVKHFGLQLLAAVLFAGAAFMMLGDWNGMPPAAHQHGIAPPLVLGIVGFIAMASAAWLGWKMVEIQHVGVNVSRPEPSASSGT
jgi:uncharacterized membrane protein